MPSGRDHLPETLARVGRSCQLQLDSVQGIASDGFVPPPAIEPNDDMWHLEKPVEFMSAPIRECDGSSCQNLLFRVGHRGRIVLETCLTRPAQLRPRRQARNQDQVSRMPGESCATFARATN